MEDNRGVPENRTKGITDGGKQLVAGEIMAEFCSWFSPEEAQEELLNLFLAAINSEEADSWNGTIRGRIIFMYRQLAKLVGAVYQGRTAATGQQ